MARNTYAHFLSICPCYYGNSCFSVARDNETGSTPSLEAVCVYSSRCIDLYRSIILLVSNALIIITFDCPTPFEFNDAFMQNNDWINVHFIVVK